MRQWEGPFPRKDIRCQWAAPSKSRVRPESRSRGLLKAQKLFARLIGNGWTKLDAIREALCIDEGPPTFKRISGEKAPLDPEEQTSKSEFDKYWSEDRLAKVAADWMRDPVVRVALKHKVDGAKSHLMGLAALAADTLARLLESPKEEIQLAALKEVLNRTGVDGKQSAGAKIHDLTEKAKADVRKALEGGDEDGSRLASVPREGNRAAG